MGEFEQTLREIFGEPIDRLTKFQSDQLRKLNEKMRDLARDAVRDEINRLEKEIADLKSRVAKLESGDR